MCYIYINRIYSLNTHIIHRSTNYINYKYHIIDIIIWFSDIYIYFNNKTNYIHLYIHRHIHMYISETCAGIIVNIK